MKFDILQAVNFTMMAWQNVLQKTIKNCFAFGGFLTPVYVNPIENAESDNFVPPENWSNLSDVTALEEFVQCDSEEECAVKKRIIALKRLCQVFNKRWWVLTPCKNTSLAVI
ncbi:hypothetical protein AVEN_68964-1 [Araneus ventricosus]|uniref:Uncharacterized protein n=1 Tax=Araneus ventricosus TaxID=182803 RepID=A0A4Y2IE48_ARAVE|nr:hypothetical protein AVEN_68964-1 [Araneus ventricosus]